MFIAWNTTVLSVHKKIKIESLKKQKQHSQCSAALNDVGSTNKVL